MIECMMHIFAFIFLFIIDRLSKMWAYEALQKKIINVCTGFQCELVWNRGVSFGTFQFESGIYFGLLTFFILLIISLVFFHTIKSYQSGESVLGEVLVLAGASSNIVDRFLYGAVLDFVDIYVGPWHWYTFNIADVFIVIGAFIIIYKYLK